MPQAVTKTHRCVGCNEWCLCGGEPCRNICNTPVPKIQKAVLVESIGCCSIYGQDGKTYRLPICDNGRHMRSQFSNLIMVIEERAHGKWAVVSHDINAEPLEEIADFPTEETY